MDELMKERQIDRRMERQMHICVDGQTDVKLMKIQTDGQ